MTYYSVADIASALGTNQETVRRWIRSGALKSTLNSNKEGNRVSDKDLRDFLVEHPKYAGIAAKSSLLGFTATVSLGKAVLERSLQDIGSLKVGEIDEWLATAKETLARKEQEVDRLRENIAVLEAMLKVLNDTDLKGRLKDERSNGSE